MTLTLQSLKTSHPTAAVLISGDRNDLDIDQLLSIDSSLKQIVSKSTRGQNLLTIFLTDVPSYFEEPCVVPPVDVDDPQKGGVPSDHMGVIVNPLSRTGGVNTRKQKITRTVRPITDSYFKNIGQVFCAQEWDLMGNDASPMELIDIFEFYTNGIIDAFCPQKKIFERPGENPFKREDMKILKRKIMREYEKRGKSPLYIDLKATLDDKIKSEKIKYKERVIDEVTNGTRHSAYSAIRKLGSRLGKASTRLFSLPQHNDLGLSDSQSAERIADHFAAISSTYKPIRTEKFSPNLRSILSSPDRSLIPTLSEFQVYTKISKAKKPNSNVPGDLPMKIIKEFACELSYPIMLIYNSILTTLEYPHQWVKEYQIPLPKNKNTYM